MDGITSLLSALEQIVSGASSGPEEGQRVAVFAAMDEKEVRFFGWGTYRGRELPPFVEDMTFEDAEKTFQKVAAEQKNIPPELATEEGRRAKFEQWRKEAVFQYKVELDDGLLAWGSECHIMPEDRMRDCMKTRRIQWVYMVRGEKGERLYDLNAGTA
jgi:hypothetical protein